MGRVADANEHLSQLNTLYMSTIETLAMAIDAKDQITHGHIRRVQIYAVRLAERMGVAETSLIKAIEAAALLHDMGKLAVPEYILNKPGPLTAAEFEKMKLHASVGADILSSIEFPYPVVPIVRHHHENWNGTGYPDGLSGAQIPIGARILSVVDCFDALTSDRPYRPRLSDKEAIDILVERRGSMYDPLVVDTFVRVHSEITPESLPTAATAPLRAITNASTSNTALAASSQPLDEIAASSEEMLTLFHLARSLTGGMSVQDGADVIAKHIRRLVPCSLCVFFVYDVDNNQLVVEHASGENASLLTGLRIELGERLSGWVAANRRSIRNSDPVLDLGEAARATNNRLRSCLSAPLLTNNSLVGVLSLYSTAASAFTEDHQRLVEVIARQVSAMIKSALEFERAKNRGLKDQVTGLPNIEHFRQFTGTTAASVSSNEPTSLILMEINGLEGVIHTFGREHSNRILAAVVRAVRRSLRAADFLFRYRDDEFLVVLLQTDIATSELIASRIRDAIAKEPDYGTGVPLDVTLIITSAPGDGNSIEELVSAAESKLDDVRSNRSARRRRPDSVH